jgi:protein SCO1/2
VGTSPEVDEASAYALSQAAVGKPMGNYRFIDRVGQEVQLAELGGRPLVISLIYTSCYHTCSVATRYLAQVVEVAQEALGADSFTVLTIGFDALSDTPDRMAAYAREQGVDLPGWKFLSADQATVEALTRNLGFVFFSSPKGFEHTVQTTLVDQSGRIYQQLYGEQFPAPNFVEPLKDLVLGVRAGSGSFSGWVDGVRLFCTIYDPASGRYRFDYSIFLGALVGVACLGCIALFLFQAWRNGDTKQRFG